MTECCGRGRGRGRGRGGRGDIVGNLDYRARQTQQGAIRSGSLLITDGNDRVFPKVS